MAYITSVSSEVRQLRFSLHVSTSRLLRTETSLDALRKMQVEKLSSAAREIFSLAEMRMLQTVTEVSATSLSLKKAVAHFHILQKSLFNSPKYLQTAVIVVYCTVCFY